MTALKLAFDRAGIKSAEDRLRDIAIKAMVAHADSTEDTTEAIWREVQKDRLLLIELFKLDSDRAIGGLLYRTRNSLTERSMATRKPTTTETRAMALAREHLERQARRRAEIEAEDAAKQRKADEDYRAYLRSWQETEIGNLQVLGKPIWKVTPGVARAWLQTQRRPLRCVELLLEGLPDDGRPIEFYRRPADVKELWNRAGASND